MAKQVQAATQEPSVFDTAKAKSVQLYISAKDTLHTVWDKLVAFFGSGLGWGFFLRIGAWLLAALVLKCILLLIGLSASLLGAFVVMGAVSLSKHFADGAVNQIVQMYEDNQQPAA